MVLSHKIHQYRVKSEYTVGQSGYSYASKLGNILFEHVEAIFAVTTPCVLPWGRFLEDTQCNSRVLSAVYVLKKTPQNNSPNQKKIHKNEKNSQTKKTQPLVFW